MPKRHCRASIGAEMARMSSSPGATLGTVFTRMRSAARSTCPASSVGNPFNRASMGDDRCPEPPGQKTTSARGKPNKLP